MSSDRINVSRVAGRIERIEARFRGNGFELHRHDTYALGVTLEGVQTFRYRGASRFSLPGNIVVLHPDELHDGAAGTDEGLRYGMLYLPPELIAGALESRGSGLPFVASPVIADPELRQSLIEAFCRTDEGSAELILDDLLVRISDGLVRNADKRFKPVRPDARSAVLRCCEFLTENSFGQIRSEELESISGMDRYSLARQFRNVLGTSPHRYLVMRRLERARALMGNGMGLAEISAWAGFADQSHLTRHFKKTYGMTPRRWMDLSAGK